jgi:hypothetical protein
MRELTVDLLNHLFEYDKETGNLIWKIKPSSRGHHVKAGDIAGTLKSHGYLCVGINYNSYRAHRLIFLMHKGYLPKTIDHINGDKLDNRIENLRAATVGQNQHNRKTNANNTSGYKGVSWNKAQKKWTARITLERKIIHLGYFANVEEAAEVVRKAREELHGSFANHGDQ